MAVLETLVYRVVGDRPLRVDEERWDSFCRGAAPLDVESTRDGRVNILVLRRRDTTCESIDALAVDGRWHAVARGVMRDELAAHHRVLAGQVVSQPGGDPDAKVRNWLERDDPALRFTLGMLADLSTQKTLDYPTLSVAVQKLGQLAARG